MNAAREIANSIYEMRTKLEKIDCELEQNFGALDIRDAREQRLNKKLEDLKQKQNDIIYFNVSGKIFPVNKRMILECPYENMLTEVVKNLINSDKLNDLQEICLDRNPKHFKVILDMIRKVDDKRNNISDFYVNKNKIRIHLNPLKIPNPQIFKEDLPYYFKNEALDKIFEDFKITYNESENMVKTLYGFNLNLTCFVEGIEVSQEYPNEMLAPYKTLDIDELSKTDNIMKAIFTDFDANVIFRFAEPIKLKKIELRPFWGDLDCWYPGDGAGSYVYYSMDKTNWEFLTVIPEDYGIMIDMIHTMEFDEHEMKYLKFENKQYALSICYIKLS